MLSLNRLSRGLKIREKESQSLSSQPARTGPDEATILLYDSDAGRRELLRRLCQGIGTVHAATTAEEALSLAIRVEVDVLLVPETRAAFSSLKDFLTPKSSVLVVLEEEASAARLLSGWPSEYFVDFIALPVEEQARVRFRRLLLKAAEHARLKRELEKLLSSRGPDEERIKEVYAEIKEIKSFINDSIVKEMEKRLSLQVRYLWFQRRKQKIEEIIKKIHIATDVSSLLDTLTDIKELIQASGMTFYILDESETLGQYLKPLVWDDAFLSHAEFSRYIALLDSQDFAAQVVRRQEDLNLATVPLEKRVAKRYIEHLKQPLRSLLSVPIRHEKEVIGVLEAYNKLHQGQVSPFGFSGEDQQVLRGLSEHISLAMTKLNLIQYDALTGLLRPDPFFDKVIQKVSLQSKRRQEIASYALVMGDVDWFKHYNDRNGHEAGNRLLRELARVLKSSIREDDLLCRYGGEEFLFFLTGIKSLEEACILTERIRKNVEEHYFENEEYQPRSNLTMSFGVTLLPTKEDYYAAINKYELKKMAIEADMALAEAKGKRWRGGRMIEVEEKELVKNKVCVYNRELAGEGGKESVIKPYRQEFFEEKRKYRRHFVSTILLYADNGHFKVTKTINLSLGGARIYSESKLPLMKTYDFLVVLENKATPFRGDIVYSLKASPEASLYCTGIKFKDMSSAGRKMLENYLASLPGRDGGEAST